MAAALKTKNFEIAEKNAGSKNGVGESTAGPWKVKVTLWAPEGAGIHGDRDPYEQTDVELFHYGHPLAELGITGRGEGFSLRTVSSFKFRGRAGYGLSKSDEEGIWLMLNHYVEDESEARGYANEVRQAARKNEGGRHPYSSEIQSRYRSGYGPKDAYPFRPSGEPTD